MRQRQLCHTLKYLKGSRALKRCLNFCLALLCNTWGREPDLEKGLQPSTSYFCCNYKFYRVSTLSPSYKLLLLFFFSIILCLCYNTEIYMLIYVIINIWGSAITTYLQHLSFIYNIPLYNYEVVVRLYKFCLSSISWALCHSVEIMTAH